MFDTGCSGPANGAGARSPGTELRTNVQRDRSVVHPRSYRNRDGRSCERLHVELDLLVGEADGLAVAHDDFAGAGGHAPVDGFGVSPVCPHLME